MKVKFFRNLEIVGAFFVFSLAFLLHYIYQLTDGTVFRFFLVQLMSLCGKTQKYFSLPMPFGDLLSFWFPMCISSHL